MKNRIAYAEQTSSHLKDTLQTRRENPSKTPSNDSLPLSWHGADHRGYAAVDDSWSE